MIGAILLAAGASRRFGTPKLLQELEGKAIVRWSAEGLRHQLVGEVVVVVPPEHGALSRALEGTGARLVVNPDADRGIGSSLACGVAALSAGTQAVLVALADEPLLSRLALEAVVARYRTGDVSIVVPRFRGVRGHPVLFQHSVFNELCALSGDEGARSVTDRDSDRVAFIELEEPEPMDVDTPADLARLREARVLGRTA